MIQHFFYEYKGEKWRDVGFFNDDDIRPEIGRERPQNIEKYKIITDNLDDATLYKAIENIKKNWDMDWRMPWYKPWDWNNCQHFGDAVMKEYERLQRKGQ